MAARVAVTGGSGFIGRALLTQLSARRDIRVHALVRNTRARQELSALGVETTCGDLRDRSSLQAFVEPGCTVVNLTQLPSASESALATSNLAETCAHVKVKRVVHCSTATVVGVTRATEVTEKTPCHPGTAYEISKLAAEDIMLAASRGNFELAILRPTAVFGAGGKNLVKLADDLRTRPMWLNYLKSCLFGYRRMNLISVENVVAALTFLVETNRKLEGEIFLASDDDSDSNNYRDVEQYLIQNLGYKNYPLSLIRTPDVVLSAILKLAGRSNVNPRRVYDSRKLSAFGFNKPVSFESGLQAFTEWYKNEFMATDRGHR